MDIGYVAIKALKPTDTNAWQRFALPLGINNLNEIACLDSMICPSVVQRLTEEDMEHRVHERLAHDFFSDLQYLERKVLVNSHVEILAVLPNPQLSGLTQFRQLQLGFEFLGFELIDVETRIDPIINCSTFRDLISPSIINTSGLISELKKAKQIQRELVTQYPDHVHSDTVLFAIWRKRSR